MSVPADRGKVSRHPRILAFAGVRDVDASICPAHIASVAAVRGAHECPHGTGDGGRVCGINPEKVMAFRDPCRPPPPLLVS